MPGPSTCPQGHQWQPANGGVRDSTPAPAPCPECGAPALPDLSEAPTLVLRRAAPDSPAPAPPVPPSSVWPLIRGYDILSELGRGGMGVVYKARQKGLGRVVALKTISSALAADTDLLARFRTEAEVIARLRHPNIIQVHDIGTCPAGPYFAMEFAEGGNLAEHWRGLPQPARPAAALLATLARAIHAAHERGILHRDLKPANILLQKTNHRDTEDTEEDTQREQEAKEARVSSPLNSSSSVSSLCSLCLCGSHFLPKITDFGLARRLDDRRGQTLPGQVMGTPGYMAPEQVEGDGRDVGRPADVYALGAILYEALTGRPPHRGVTSEEALHHLLALEPPAPSRLRADVPRDLETICLKCLSKDPRRRYATALELADDLTRFLDGKPITARPTPAWERAWKWARRQPGTAALAGCLLALTALGFLLVTAQWRRAQVEQRQSERERQRAVAIARAEGEARLEAQRLSTQLLLERGVSLCESGEEGAGLLWLLRALEMAPAEDASLQGSLRALLGAWARQVHPLLLHLPHPEPVAGALFSPDGRALVTASGQRVYRHDAETARLLGTPLDLPGRPLALARRPDGTLLAAAEEANAVSCRLLDTGRPLGKPLPHPDRVHSASFDPSGRLLLTGCGDGLARLWDLDTGTLRGRPWRHGGAVLSVAFGPDGRAATGSADRTARVWDVAEGKVLAELRGHAGAVHSLAFSPGGRRLLTGGADHRALLWDWRAGAVKARLVHRHDVDSVAFDPSGRVLATGSADDSARLWDADTGRPLGARLLHHGDVSCVAFRPDGKALLTAGEDGTARLWPVRPAGPARALRHPRAVLSLAVHPEGHRVLTGCADGILRLWDLDTGREQVVDRDVIALAVAFRPDGGAFLAGCWDRTLRLSDARTGRPLRAPLAHGAPVLSACFGPGGKTVVTGCDDDDRVVRVWDVASGKVLRTLAGHARKVPALALSPDGRKLLSGSWDRTARLWEVRTGKTLGAPLRHQDLVQQVAFHPGGRVVLTGGDDYTTRLWDVGTGRPLGIPLRHPGKVEAVAFSPGGARFATGSKDRSARLWDTATAKPLGPPLPHGHEVHAVAFLPGGQALVTASWDGAVRVWELPAPWTAGVADIRRWLHRHTGLRLNDHGEVIPLDLASWRALRD